MKHENENKGKKSHGCSAGTCSLHGNVLCNVRPHHVLFPVAVVTDPNFLFTGCKVNQPAMKVWKRLTKW